MIIRMENGMRRAIGISILIVLTAAGCGSGGSESSDATTQRKSETTTSESLVTEKTTLIDTTAIPTTAPTATYAVVEGEIDTPAEAAQSLVNAGITCDRYQDVPPNSSPPHLAGSCDSGDSVIFFSVWQGDAATIVGSINTSTNSKLNYKNSGRTEVNSVISGHNSYGLAPLDHVLRNGGVPTEAELKLLNQIAVATGGELKTWNY